MDYETTADAITRNIWEISTNNGAHGQVMTRQIRTTKRRCRPPHQAATIIDRDEAAAIAGAKAEARGLTRRANPYRQTPDLRAAWAIGWTLSRQDRSRERIT